MPRTRGYYSCAFYDFPSLSMNESICDRKALFLRRLLRREEAIESALLSIAGYPWNWAVWTVFGECIGDGEEVASYALLVA